MMATGFWGFWMIINEISLRTMLQCPSCVLMIDNKWPLGRWWRAANMFGADLQCNGRLQCTCTPPPHGSCSCRRRWCAQCAAIWRPDPVYILHTVLPRPAQRALLSYPGCSCRLACDWWSLRSLCALIGRDCVLQPAWSSVNSVSLPLPPSSPPLLQLLSCYTIKFLKV